jgi:hypothetical protein
MLAIEDTHYGLSRGTTPLGTAEEIKAASPAVKAGSYSISAGE